jgi:hypothetical protein
VEEEEGDHEMKWRKDFWVGFIMGWLSYPIGKLAFWLWGEITR